MRFRDAIVDGRRQKFIPEMRLWHYEAHVGMLRQTSGSLAMRVRVDTPIADAAHVQSRWAIRVVDLAQWMTSQAEAMAKLSAFAPESAVSASFPGTCSDKLQLLNGWLSPAGQRSRQAYRRARWYLRRRRDQTRISLEVCSELGGPFTLLVNGEPLATVSLPPAEWKWFSVDLSGAPFDEAFVMEIRLERAPWQFSEGLSSVRRRRIGESGMKRLMRGAQSILPSAAALG